MTFVIGAKRKPMESSSDQMHRSFASLKMTTRFIRSRVALLSLNHITESESHFLSW
jgi:hypothetical protein